jgi:hypothetical protein
VGKVVVGGGGLITGAAAVALTQSRATSNTTWTVTAVETTSIGTVWTVQAFAICLTGP